MTELDTAAVLPLIETSDNPVSVWAKIVLIQGDLENVKVDTTGRIGERSYRYASLGGLVAVVRPIISKHLLGFVQAPHVSPQADGSARVTVVTQLFASDGEWIRTSLTLRAESPDPKPVGSAITYARRYGLQCLLGIASESDDDGDGATFERDSWQPEADQPKCSPALWNEIGLLSGTTSDEGTEKLKAWKAEAGLESITAYTITDAQAGEVLDIMKAHQVDPDAPPPDPDAPPPDPDAPEEQEVEPAEITGEEALATAKDLIKRQGHKGKVKEAEQAKDAEPTEEPAPDAPTYPDDGDSSDPEIDPEAMEWPDPEPAAE